MILITSLACEDPIKNEFDDGKTHWPEASFIAGPEGGYFKTLDGNVELFFPENAITKKVDFCIEDGSEDKEGGKTFRKTTNNRILFVITPIQLINQQLFVLNS